MDVIMLHQSGFHNAVAVLGTALTKEHIPIIKKFDAKVIFTDADKALRRWRSNRLGCYLRVR